MNLNKLQELNNETTPSSDFSLDDIYFKDCFTKTEDKINMEVNKASVDCITSNKNTFSIDEDGNMLMKSLASDSGKFSTDSNGNLKINSISSFNGKFSIDEDGNLKASNINGASIDFDEISFLDKIYPIGSLLFNTSNLNPNTYLGIGTWVLWGAGKVPVGVDANQTEFNEVEKTGGEKTHLLTINEMPSHNHTVGRDNDGGGGSTYGTVHGNGPNGANWQVPSGYTGGGQSHNNLQPYITCYMWKRTL